MRRNLLPIPLVLLMVSLGLILRWPSIGIAANPPQPTYGTAIVDGNYGEWNVANDFFGNMYNAGNPSKAHTSNGYLRYDCSADIMYVLVLQQGTTVLLTAPGNAWTTING